MNNYSDAEFIPYSDFDKMTEEEKIKKPIYCPDRFPFLCNIKTVGFGTCQHKKSYCNRKIINKKIIVPLIYHLK